MSDWTTKDLRAALRVLPIWWDLLAQGISAEAVSDLRARSQARRDALEGPDDPRASAAVEACLADVSAAGRIVTELGAVPPMRGALLSVHVSGGGVPKHSVPAADIDQRGVEGDHQNHRRRDGRPWQALCLWSAEVIERLRAEGHRVAPGRAGENLTLSGLDWAALRPGVRLRVGDAVAELAIPAAPCAQNAQWFAGGDFMRMDHGRHPGSSRWYASVVEPGAVRPGDPVEVLP